MIDLQLISFCYKWRNRRKCYYLKCVRAGRASEALILSFLFSLHDWWRDNVPFHIPSKLQFFTFYFASILPILAAYFFFMTALFKESRRKSARFAWFLELNWSIEFAGGDAEIRKSIGQTQMYINHFHRKTEGIIVDASSDRKAMMAAEAAKEVIRFSKR